jgi:hypothetical protein
MKKELFTEVIIPVRCSGEVHQVGVSIDGPLRVLSHPGTSTSGLLRMWELMGKPEECGCARLVHLHRINPAGRTNLWTWNKMHFPESWTNNRVTISEQHERVLTSHLGVVYRFQEGKYDTRKAVEVTYEVELPRPYPVRAEELRQSRFIEKVEAWLDAVGRTKYDYDIRWNDTQDTAVHTRFTRRRSDGCARVQLTVNSKRWRDMLFFKDDTGQVLITACTQDTHHYTMTRYKEMRWDVEGLGYDASSRSFVRKTGTLTYNIGTQALAWAWRS